MKSYDGDTSYICNFSYFLSVMKWDSLGIFSGMAFWVLLFQVWKGNPKECVFRVNHYL